MARVRRGAWPGPGGSFRGSTSVVDGRVADKPIEFVAEGSVGKIKETRWEFGPGQTMHGKRVRHVFCKPGICQVHHETPTGASLRFDKRKEGNLYPNNPLGN